jgi:thiol-disulfide isomerase/thioredoxin
MFRYRLFFYFSASMLITNPGNAQTRISTGTWEANLKINDITQLPFRLQVSKKQKQYQFTIHNASETIELGTAVANGDSMTLNFPNFHSSIKFKADDKKTLQGYWVNYNKGEQYKIPFHAALKSAKNKAETLPENNLAGRWKTTFDAEKSPWMAIGVFEQKGEIITGTFLTETGDFRFLEGKVKGNTMNLSCFDGSHAFHFTGTFENKQLKGTFYSGKHFAGSWEAVLDPAFELRHPDSVTYLVKNEPVTFKLKDLEGKEFSYPNADYKNKVTIIQIMGTWCPNCMDETKFLNELYAKYHAQGLEIISIGYETPVDFEQQAEKIRMLKQRHNLNFKFLVGGQANKAFTSQQFPMLNEIISYPTAIVIGKDGEVKKIHTGFNGPGTGKLYADYASSMNAFIEILLQEK